MPHATLVGMEIDEVVEHLLKGAHWTASRSSGPGGQHRDKASTRAELTIDQDSLTGLTALDPALAERLEQGLGLVERALRIAIQDERSLSRNQDIAVDRLTELVTRALAPPPPTRRPTRPSRARREVRLSDKARRGDTKRLRRPPGDQS
ncbi:MAG TPA: peptide chain release factor-like protein [Chloroflexota bacterium]|jgi:ribosome-associated protein|nr:peptide chain release factor-like protein [Chloroflexota bacterium]